LELAGNLEVKVLAGGQSLIPSLKLRVPSPKALVDITGIKDLCYVRHEGQVLTISALTAIVALTTAHGCR
jgi:carbon-monoxide dehydrogenase medium subunit